MKVNRLITSVICSLVAASTAIQAEPTRPRLVVGIVVDQLRTDYLEYLQSLFGANGFRRLMTEGAYLRNVDFNAGIYDAATATALLYTGAYPSQNGVTAASMYDRTRNKTLPALSSGTSYSPENLVLSTIADEIAIDGMGLGSIYSLAADPQMAVIMAGHAGTSAAWISDLTGQWSSAPYYTDTRIAHNMGLARRGVNARIDTMQWRPVLPTAKYACISDAKRSNPFRYSFSRSDRDVYRKYLASPKSNHDITQTAIDYLRIMRPGSRKDGMDMLNIGLTVAPYPYTSDGDSRLELQDAYLRLDADIAALLNAIDQYVGLENSLVYLSSTGYYEDSVPVDEKFKIPTGTFSVKRALSLLNAYLSAAYGAGDYVGGYSAGHYYLNTKTIENHRLDVAKVAAEAREFLTKMSGVADAWTLGDIQSGGDSTEALRHTIDPKHGGDIYVAYTPGWIVTDDTVYPAQTHTERSAAIASPFFMIGGGVAPKVIGEPVEATVIAPTITQSLRIRAPNGARSRPLLLN